MHLQTRLSVRILTAVKGRKLGCVFVCICVSQRLFVVLAVCVSSVRICQLVFAETYLVCACAICQVGRNFSSSLLPALLLHLCLQVFLCFVPH